MFPLLGQRPPWHDKQLEAYYNTVCSDARLCPRSIVHYVLIYNRLPQWLVDKKNVQAFQKGLNAVAKISVEVGTSTWREAFQSCMDVVNTFH